MEAKFQSSFIPNKSDAGSGSVNELGKVSRGVPYFIGATIFTIVILASIAVFAYEKYLEYRINKMQDSLAMTRESLNPELIEKITREDARIKSAEDLINKHVTISALYKALENATLQNVSYESFSLKGMRESGEQMVIIMKGQTNSYASLALQAEIFATSPDFMNPSFSNLDLNDEGNVTFALETAVNLDTVSYVKNLERNNFIIPEIPENTLSETVEEDGFGTTTENVEQDTAIQGDLDNQTSSEEPTKILP